MKRVYLFCSAGMSTSMLARKMQGVANSHNLPRAAAACPAGTTGQLPEGRRPDVILLGPQVKFRYQEIVSEFGSTGIPIQVIDQTAYGMMDGEKVLKSAIKLLKAAK